MSLSLIRMLMLAGCSHARFCGQFVSNAVSVSGKRAHAYSGCMASVCWTLACPMHTPGADCSELPAGLQSFPGVDKYVKALLEARKGKNITQDVAVDAVTNDVNMFGVMMVAMGDAGGMVSGSIHTTAATIRPAMQVLKTPNLVSSIFFMCLPDKVSAQFGSCVMCCWCTTPAAVILKLGSYCRAGRMAV